MLLRFATSVVLLVPLTGLPAAATATTPTCHDLPVTIHVGAGQTVVQGTDGNDVILAEGSSHVVQAGAGDDTVCTSSGNDDIYPGAGNDWVSAGEGNDVLWDDEGDDELAGDDGIDLLATDFTGTSTAKLGDVGSLSGQGADSLTKVENYRQTGPGSASVTSGVYTTQIETGSGSSTLVALGRSYSPALSIVTGASSDTVEVRRPGVTVSTHGGQDIVTVTDLVGTTRVLDDADGITVSGGSGVEDLQVHGLRGAAGPVRLDLGEGNDLVDVRANDMQIQTGPGSDTVAAGHLRFTANTGWVRLGGGNDFFLLDGVPMGSMAQHVSGQGGRDTVVGTPYHDQIDLASYAAWGSGSASGGVEIDGFEQANGQGSGDLLSGTAASNVFRGGAGADTLKGAGGADVLLGGPDRDRADGGPGSDRCVAEVRRSCER